MDFLVNKPFHRQAAIYRGLPIVLMMISGMISSSAMAQYTPMV
jgi:hypothetical protein